MGRRGPAPTPTSVLKLRGSWRGDANPEEPQPERGVPDMPEFLEGMSKECWDQLVPLIDGMNVLTLADEVALSMLCKTYANWRRAEALLEKHGDVYPIRDDAGNVKYLQQSPYVSIARNNLLALKGMLEQFGLTPSARSRLRVEPDKTVAKQDARMSYLTDGA